MIKTNSKGMYVSADRVVIKGDDPEVWKTQVEDYINNSIRKNKDIFIKDNKGNLFIITENTAGKATYRNSISENGNYRKLTDEEFARKLRAEVHIDEIMQISSKAAEDLPDEKNHDFAKDGFMYRSAYFEDFDGQYYKLTISVGKAGGFNTVYNIGKIQKRKNPSYRDSKVSQKKSNYEGFNKDRITQNAPSVNSDSMQKSENNTQNEKASVPGARVSDIEARKNVGSLESENRKLREQIENMQLQLDVNEEKGVDAIAVKRIAKDIKEAYKSSSGLNWLHKELLKLYNSMAEKNVDGDEVQKRASDIAKKIIREAVYKNDDLANEYYDLLDMIRNTRIKVPEAEKADFADGYNYYRVHYTMGKLKLTNDGYPLDVFWDDLCEQYPYFFSSDTVSSEERLNRLLEVREELMPIEESYFEGDAANRAQLALTNEIINGFFRVPEATEKGKKYVFYDKRASDYEKSMEKMRETQLFVFW